MSPFVVVAGLSGVGKSTALSAAKKVLEFEHLVASELIKEASDIGGASLPTSEQLRLGDLDQNQRILVSEVLRRRSTTQAPWVLDAHLVIDGKDGLTTVSSDVFRHIGITALILLTADPSEILKRRSGDKLRERPMRSALELKQQQEYMIDHGKRVAKELLVSVQVVQSEDLGAGLASCFED